MRATPPQPADHQVAELLPPNAKPGECYTKVFVPEKFETTKETILVRDSSERLEIVPARYEWVEESIVLKDAYTVLEEIPAEFRWEDHNVLVDPGHVGWHMESTPGCATGNDPNRELAKETYCFVEQEPVYRDIRTEVMVKPASTHEVTIPAEYQTVRRQKLVAPATTRRIPIPAEYATVDRIMKTEDSRVEWQRVLCEDARRAEVPSPLTEPLARSGN